MIQLDPHRVGNANPSGWRGHWTALRNVALILSITLPISTGSLEDKIPYQSKSYNRRILHATWLSDPVLF